MKRIAVLLLSFILLFSLCACSAAGHSDAESAAAPQTQPSSVATEPPAASAPAQTTKEEQETMQIKVSDAQGHEVVFALNGSSAARDLHAQLPLRVEVENYSTNEKIFYPEALDVSDTPAAEVAVGTLAYYAPWGDVVMFYDTYRANPSLYALGRVVSGEEEIRALSGMLEITAQ